jgi:hypothetical protein
MDTIDSGLKIAQQLDNQQSMSISNNFVNNGQQSQATIYEDLNFENLLTSPNLLNSNKYANLLKLYEYQIVEMQHEYELLLEDKVNLKK